MTTDDAANITPKIRASPSVAENLRNANAAPRRTMPSPTNAHGTTSVVMIATNASKYDNKLFYQQGAVPFKRDGKIAGAAGAGGASPQQDEDVARVVASLLGDV